jgi:hypothetical protein
MDGTGTEAGQDVAGWAVLKAAKTEFQPFGFSSSLGMQSEFPSSVSAVIVPAEVIIVVATGLPASSN